MPEPDRTATPPIPKQGENPMTTTTITRADNAAPILFATGASTITLRAGTTLHTDKGAADFFSDTTVSLGDLAVGEDYGVRLDDDGNPVAIQLDPEQPISADIFAGFHFAPGGNATTRSGGDNVPAINPHSIWDTGFRPVADPRGMTCVEIAPGHRAWIDIYLLGVDHARHGTSRYGVRIADGGSLDRLNYHDAVAIAAQHGKRLPTYEEFRAAAYGVTEKSSADRHPKTTGIDAARTSRYGLMQATGNLWQWGTDGDPDDPRPSFFGGSWVDGSTAGSRYAYLDLWAEYSNENFGCRAASDHLIPA